MFEVTSNFTDTLLLTGSIIKILAWRRQSSRVSNHIQNLGTQLKIRVMTWRPFRLSPQINHENPRGNLQNPGQHLQKSFDFCNANEDFSAESTDGCE